jgi:LuxR family maltose regulon positive regulatory protein
MDRSFLLQTKFLAPRLGGEWLPRPELLARVEQATVKRLTLLSAAPGYGKTTLLAELTRTTGLPYAWYQLDTADGDPAIFLSYLITCMRQIETAVHPHTTATLGHTAVSLLEAGDPLPPERVLAVFINELAERLPGDYLLILEDYHLVTNPAVHHLVNILLENGPAGLHLLISSRTDPPLGLGRLRARGLLAEFRAADLRFGAAEVQAWLEKAIPGTAVETAHLLNDKTEGWAAALQIVLSSLAGKDANSADRFIAELSGTQRFIFNYLAEEVFRQNSRPRQIFLTHTAVLDQMNAAACDALLQSHNAQLTLDELEQDNLFIVCLDEKREWYRYHYLFREFLLGKLRREQPDRLAELERAAGDYYASRGELEPAFAHYARASAHHPAAQVLARFARDYVERGRVAVLLRYLGDLPDEITRQYPELLLQYGNVLWRLGQVGTAVSRYEDAQIAFTAQGDHAGVCRVLTQLAELARSQGDYRRAQTLATAALQAADEADHANRANALMTLAKSEGFLMGMDRGRALAEESVAAMRQAGEALSPRARANLLRSLGHICWWHGDARATLHYCQEALQFVADERSPIAASIYITMATPYVYRDLETAQRYGERGLEIAQQLQLTELLPRAYTTLGSILSRRGEWERAESCLRQAMEQAQGLGLETYARVMAAGYLAQNLCGQGRVDEAWQLAETAVWERAANPDTYEMVVCRSVLADVALEKGRLDEAQAIFESLVAVGERRQFQIPLAMIYFGLAYVHLRHGRTEQALPYARQSVAILEPSGIWQLYLDQGERARLVCGALMTAGQATPFVTEVLRRLPALPDVKVIEKETAVRVQCLGLFRVFVGGQEVSPEQWVSAKARDMLAYFVTCRHERIPLERAMEAIWPESDGHGRAFHSALYRLRQALRRPGETTKFIDVKGGEYWLDRSRFEMDVEGFETAVSRARATTAGEAAFYYEQAITLYGGDYLSNLLYYDWAVPERQRLQTLYITALRRLAAYHANQGHNAQAITLLERAIAADPLQEECYCDLMRYYAAVGDKTSLARQYKQLQTRLQTELNVPPSSATQQLYQQLTG